MDHIRGSFIRNADLINKLERIRLILSAKKITSNQLGHFANSINKNLISIDHCCKYFIYVTYVMFYCDLRFERLQ